MIFFYRTHTQVFKHIKVSNVKLSLGSSAYIGLGFFLNQKIMSYFCGLSFPQRNLCLGRCVYNLTKIEFAGDEQSERVSLWAFGHLSEIPVVVYKCFIRNGRLSLTLSASVFLI